MDNDNSDNHLIANTCSTNVNVPKRSTLIYKGKKEKRKPNSNQPLDFPLVKQLDNELLLPQYFEVLSRSANCGVKMDDLDQLQCDLEKLLSTCVVRKQLLSLRKAATNLEQKFGNGRRHNTCYQKQKKLGRGKYTQPYLHKNKFVKIRFNPSSVTNNSLGTPSAGISVVNFPNNTLADSFWCFTEPYVRTVTKSDLAFIDKLIQDSRRSIYARKSNEGKTLLSKCPRLYQCPNKVEVLQTSGSDDKAIHKIKGQSTYDDAISLEIQKCVSELAGVSKNNVGQLCKLRKEAIKDLYSHQIIISRSSNRNCY